MSLQTLLTPIYLIYLSIYLMSLQTLLTPIYLIYLSIYLMSLQTHLLLLVKPLCEKSLAMTQCRETVRLTLLPVADVSLWVVDQWKAYQHIPGISEDIRWVCWKFGLWASNPGDPSGPSWPKLRTTASREAVQGYFKRLLEIRVLLSACIGSGCKESKWNHSLWRSPMDETPLWSEDR